MGTAGEAATVADEIGPAIVGTDQSAHCTSIVFPCVSGRGTADEATDRATTLRRNAGMGADLATAGAAVVLVIGHMVAPWLQCEEHTAGQIGAIASGCFIINLIRQQNAEATLLGITAGNPLEGILCGGIVIRTPQAIESAIDGGGMQQHAIGVDIDGIIHPAITIRIFHLDRETHLFSTHAAHACAVTLVNTGAGANRANAITPAMS